MTQERGSEIEPIRFEPDDGGASTETWRALLTGEDPSLRQLRRWWRRVPSSPRCKVCAAPFQGVGGLVTRVVMHGRSEISPLLCRLCFGQLGQRPGGAEIELSVLFADVRGSTAIAEQSTASAFRDRLQRFYRIAAAAIERHDGIVDKFLGDGVMALFIPVIAGESHSGRAIEAGEALLAALEDEDPAGTGIGVGAGIHTGTAYVGTLGTAARLDFSALGDTVNIAARLGSVAGPGELLVGRAAWDAAGRPVPAGGARQVEIVGRSAPLEVVVARPARVVAGAA